MTLSSSTRASQWSAQLAARFPAQVYVLLFSSRIVVRNRDIVSSRRKYSARSSSLVASTTSCTRSPIGKEENNMREKGNY